MSDDITGNGNGTAPTTPESQPEKPKGKMGAPYGNVNGFQYGTALLARAKKKKLRIRQRRVIAEVTTRLTEDLGGDLSEAQRLIVAIVARQCGRLDKVHRCYDRLMKANPDLLNKPGALHRIDQALGPMEQRVVSNLVTLGLKRISKPRDIYSWQSPGEGDGGDGRGDNGKVTVMAKGKG